MSDGKNGAAGEGGTGDGKGAGGAGEGEGKQTSAAGAGAGEGKGEGATMLTTGDGKGAGSGDGKGKEGEGQGAGELELKFPEGMKVDDGQLKAFKDMAKDLGLDNAKAQKLVDFYLGGQKEQLERAQKSWDEERAGWMDELKQDKDFGGDKFDANVIIAKKAIAKFDVPGLKEFLDKTGAGDHPAVVRFAFKVGRELLEDKIGVGTAPGADKSEGALLKQLYPNSPELFGKS